MCVAVLFAGWPELLMRLMRDWDGLRLLFGFNADNVYFGALIKGPAGVSDRTHGLSSMGIEFVHSGTVVLGSSRKGFH